jgi:hypothetical protein
MFLLQDKAGGGISETWRNNYIEEIPGTNTKPPYLLKSASASFLLFVTSDWPYHK